MRNGILASTVCVVGLGYVGLPLAQAFSGKIRTIGFDIDSSRIASIKASSSGVHATDDPSSIREADFVLICVPTPVTKGKTPDLGPVRSAARLVGKNLKPGATVVLESTVYPGVTEDIVAPILELESGLKCGKDFFVGYSPERMNPNDPDHTIDKITKVVGGMDEKTLRNLESLYSLVTHVYCAPDIRTAEAAKVIENIQRDINIALVNELSLIFARLGIDTGEVLKAAGTKWNFQQYRPGLVGGHCIPVDPYYLVSKAQEVGYHPQVILAGRAVNDSIPRYVAEMAIRGLNESGKVIRNSKILIMGLTYKEDVPDIRESQVEHIIGDLLEFRAEVYGNDPILTGETISDFGVKPMEELGAVKVDCIILAVAHRQYKKLGAGDFADLMTDRPVFIDVRGMIDRSEAERLGIYYRRL